MNPVMGHQWEDLFQDPLALRGDGVTPGRIVGVSHLCCECAYARPLRNESRCRCAHPSSEFADGVLFAGAPACAAFAARRHHAEGAFTNGSGGAALLRGN